MTFGKVMGGGFPAAAFGGRADVMRKQACPGSVTHRKRLYHPVTDDYRAHWFI